LALWCLAALGVYHVAHVAGADLRRARYRGGDVRDPSNQLRFVMAAGFATKPIMGISEYRVFRIVEDEVLSHHRGHRVFAQTSLGEILRTADDRARSSINSKRVDILVIATNGDPVLVVEYHGGGHHQNNAAARDAVKREALRKAGVQYLEISRSHSFDEIAGLVHSALVKATAARSMHHLRRKVSPSGYLRSSSGTGTSKPLSVTETRQ
jgi:hypothetical protein